MSRLSHLKTYFTNPISIYISWILSKAYLEIKWYKTRLKIGYMSICTNCRFGKYVNIASNSNIYNCFIDDFTYVSNACNISNTRIGKFCSIASNVQIAQGKHPTHTFISTHPSTYKTQGGLVKCFTSETKFNYNPEVIIGNDVWIGTNAVICEGVVIADGAIIGANSVITKNVDPYTIVQGSPQQVIRKRFDDETISKLSNFLWWNKDENWIQENISFFWDKNDFKLLIENSI